MNLLYFLAKNNEFQLSRSKNNENPYGKDNVFKPGLEGLPRAALSPALPQTRLLMDRQGGDLQSGF